MITIKITPKQIAMHGHAGRSVNGQDIVCAAISALTCTLISSLESLTDNRIRADTGPGETRITWEELDEPGKLLVDAWFLGLTQINEIYNCITFM